MSDTISEFFNDVEFPDDEQALFQAAISSWFPSYAITNEKWKTKPEVMFVDKISDEKRTASWEKMNEKTKCN